MIRPSSVSKYFLALSPKNAELTKSVAPLTRASPAPCKIGAAK